MKSNILIVTPRKSLAREFYQNFNQLGFEYYENKDAFMSKKLICQVDSLYRVHEAYDIIILDEYETIASHIVSFDQMTEKSTILFTLENLINASEKTFVIDANLTKDTIDLFKSTFKSQKFTNLSFNYQTFKDKPCHFIVGSKGIKAQHCNFVIKSLKNGLKVSCPVYSLDYLKDLEASVKKELPDCKILTISSEHFFDSVAEFVNYDLIIYTSTLLCGNNFNTPHFNIIIPFISNTQSSAKLYSQQILRIRQFDKIIIFINEKSTKNSKIVIKDEILTRWKYDYKERLQKGILYNHTIDEFTDNFYFQLILNQTIEIENAPILLLTDLYEILNVHGFNISGESFQIDETVSKFIKYDKKDDYIKIIQAGEMTDKKLESHSYTPHEYTKYLIEKTFKIKLVLDDKMIDLVRNVHNIVPNHENYMILNKYKVDDAIYLHTRAEISKLSKSDFIPYSKAELKNNFLHQKGLEFIKKYNVMDYTPDKDKEFKIDKDEFIEWYNVRDEENVNFVPRIGKTNNKIVVPRTINTLLKIHGIKLISKKIQNDKERNRKYLINTLIDYNKLDSIGVIFDNLPCKNLDYFDLELERRDHLKS